MPVLRARLRLLVLPVLSVTALTMLVGFSEAWGGSRWRPAYSADSSDAGARRKALLERLPKEPDLLINVSAWELPATTDMVELGKAITPAMVNGLVNSMDADVRATCATVLASTRDPRALEPLLDSLDDPAYRVQSQSLSALSSIESRQATARLLSLLDKPRVPDYVKREAISALGRLGDPAAVKPLVAYFQRTWDEAAQEALWDLRRHLSSKDLDIIVISPLKAKEPSSLPESVLSFSVEKSGLLKLTAAAPYLQSLTETFPGLQNRIIHSLGLIGNRSAVPWLESLLDSTAEARLLNNVVFALDRLGTDVQPFLTKALQDRRAYIRFNAAFVAGDLKLAKMVPSLGQALADPNDFVRSEVAVALGKIASKDAIPALEKAAAEENPVVRRDALLALATIDYKAYGPRVVSELVPHTLPSVRQKGLRFLAAQGDANVISTVLAALDPQDYSAAGQAIVLLDRFDRLDNPDALAYLLRLASASSQRRDALRLLARFQDDRVRFILRQWLSQPAEEQDQLLRAMGRLKDEASRPVARAWLDRRPMRSRLYGAFMLACLGDKEGAEVLLKAVEEAPPELKQVAATLLTEVDLKAVPELAPRLSKLLAHEDVFVRLTAARALIQANDQAAFARLRLELDKRIPFIQDEVLDILERAPLAYTTPVLQVWLPQVDPMLKVDLQRLLERA